MTRVSLLHRLLPLAFLLAASVRSYGCAACLGNSDSAMAQAMNWGILTLLVVVMGVLLGIAAFFVFIARRSATVLEGTSMDEFPPTSKKFA